MKLKFGNKAIDFSVSTLPTLFGEKIVMRLLDKDKLMLDMTKLGFESTSLAKFETNIQKPWGMVLVTGPTGSGKTNTLYSSIAKLNSSETNIMTAEDPVEFNLPGVNQVQVREQIGLVRAIEGDGFRVNDHYHALGDRFDRPEHRCPMAYLLTIIGADQVVYSCQDKAYTQAGALGSIRERRFRDFWRSEETKAALAGIDPSRDCRHHCVASTKNERILEYLSLDPEHARFV